MQIFTFWEPRENIPYYLRLCMATWQKYLPDAEVTLLDMQNIGRYIDIKIFGEKLFSGRFSLPQIADAIRVAVLAKHGGVWLDVDTIILDRIAKKYFESNDGTIFFGDTLTRSCRICFINSAADTKFMNSWLEFIQRRIEDLTPNTPVGWDFLGNIFVDPYSEKNRDEIKIIPSISTMPELSALGLETSAASSARTAAYVDYYFLQQRHIEDVSAEILLLHNSWTPRQFIEMDKNNFLRCNCTMANVLMAALNMKRNLDAQPIFFTAN